jgi:predicted nucleic acid-binding protein
VRAVVVLCRAARERLGAFACTWDQKTRQKRAVKRKRTMKGLTDLFAFINTLQSMPQTFFVHIDQAMHQSAWRLLKSYSDKEWSFVDTSSFVVMTQLAITEVLTTDHHFSQAGFIRLQ